ncbi:MAG: MFS transporter [Verrucomicrobiales bacterium]
MLPSRRAIWSWAFIDWANSAFAIVVMTAFFPIFFKRHWCVGPGLTAEKSTAYLGFTNSAAGLIIAVLAPWLGALADQGGAKKRFLLGFTLLGCASTAALPLVAQGEFLLAACLYALAAIGFSGNNMFSDSLLIEVAEPSLYNRVSALGYALGYVGSGCLFVACSLMVKNPADFGLDGPLAAMRAAFWLTGAWWAIFTIPALIWIREPAAPPRDPAVGSALVRGCRQWLATLRAIMADAKLPLFLGAYVLYIDGVNTVIKMATDFGLTIGLKEGDLLLALIVTQFVGFPSAIAFGRLGERIGARTGILIGIGVYTAVCLFATTLDSSTEFFALAVVIGLVQGGVQALSRSYFASLIPASRGAEFFGFYNMVGKFSAILGPTLMGATALVVGTRASILSLLLLFGGGAWLLSKIPKTGDPKFARAPAP